MHAYRSHTCADLNVSRMLDKLFVFADGFTACDHGGVFVYLRDHYGVTQVIADADSPIFRRLNCAANGAFG